jgi:hypothetical protein
MPALFLATSLALLLPSGGGERLDSVSAEDISHFQEDVCAECSAASFSRAIRAIEDANPEDRPAAILRLALSRNPAARSWLVALARNDAFARSWCGEAPGLRSVAAARLGLGLLGGRAAEGELAALLASQSAEGRLTRLATLSGLAALRSRAPAGEAQFRLSDAPLRRAARSRTLAPELRELAAALGAQRTRTPVGTTLSELVAARDFAAWEECGRRALLDPDPARARIGAAVEDWLQNEGRDPLRAAPALLASARRTASSLEGRRRGGTRDRLDRRTQGLLEVLVHCVPEAGTLVADLNRALVTP